MDGVATIARKAVPHRSICVFESSMVSIGEAEYMIRYDMIEELQRAGGPCEGRKSTTRLALAVKEMDK